MGPCISSFSRRVSTSADEDERGESKARSVSADDRGASTARSVSTEVRGAGVIGVFVLVVLVVFEELEDADADAASGIRRLTTSPTPPKTLASHTCTPAA
jgi:hypothetical protein